jgi:hypothetical protein
MDVNQINTSLASMELALAHSLFGFMAGVHEAYDAKLDTMEESVLDEMESDLEIPTDPDEAFGLLWDVASEMVEDPEDYEDAISMFASYFAEMGGSHMSEVAAGGIAAVDSGFVSEMLGAMDYDPKADLEDAVANIVEMAQGVLAGDE